VKLGREGLTISIQLHGGLRSPNRNVTPVGTTTICMAGGATVGAHKMSIVCANMSNKCRK
jgi:hypothetical protein